jgi:hypothetical protein
METQCDTRQTRPLALVLLAASGVAAGAALGATVNGINGLVSPEYFRTILGWYDVDISHIWRACIAQGIFEGLLFGLFLALVFTVVIGVVSKAQCSYWRGSLYVIFVVGAALISWAVGGLIAMGLATLSPEFYCHAFRGVPSDPSSMLRYAWVGGSIWGIEFGGFVFTLLGCVLFHSRWRQSDSMNAQKSLA